MSDLVKAEPKPLAAPANDEFSKLLALADKGVDPGVLERMVALHERLSETARRQAFASAFAAYTSERPVIVHNAKADIVSQKGSRFGYSYATLDAIDRAITPVLQRHGLSYAWDCAVEGGTVTVTCKLKHNLGHVETATIKLPTGTSAGMSEQQKVAAAITFGQRKTLIMVAGVSTAETDIDGQDAGTSERITPEQVREIEDLLDATDSDRTKLLAYFRVQKLADLSAEQYATAMSMFDSKIKERKTKAQ